MLQTREKSATIRLMNTVRLSAGAKLNLTLDVLGRRENYHSIDSLVTSIDLSDRIVAKKRKDGQIFVQMHGMGSENIPPDKNNAQRAGERFVQAFQTTGADIAVYKNIPIGAGLGGSSADAAGVLRALGKLYGVPLEALKPVADELGSDTGYLLSGGFARLRGRGEQVELLGDPPDLHFLLLCPKEGVSTAECYRKSDELAPLSPHTEEALSLINSGNLEWAVKLFSNGLFPAAKALCADICRAEEELLAFSPLKVNLTGSGSGVYAVFESRELCEWAKSRYKGKFRAYLLRPKKNFKEFSSPFSLGGETN